MICYTNLQLARSENPQRLKAAASLVYSDVHEELKDVQAYIKRENMIVEKLDSQQTSISYNRTREKY